MLLNVLRPPPLQCHSIIICNSPNYNDPSCKMGSELLLCRPFSTSCCNIEDPSTHSANKSSGRVPWLYHAMNCTVVNTKEYKRPLVLETLITADLVLFSMNDRFDRVNRSFINTTGGQLSIIEYFHFHMCGREITRDHWYHLKSFKKGPRSTSCRSGSWLSRRYLAGALPRYRKWFVWEHG